jgi:hypothetical protein
MPFVPSGKKAKQAREKKAREARLGDDEVVIKRAVNAAWYAGSRSGICVQMCVLLERILDAMLPTAAFGLRLGALHVVPAHQTDAPLTFDPRGPAGAIDAHAWLEDTHGRLLDPSIIITLAAEGYLRDDDTFILTNDRVVKRDGLTLLYEAVPGLELTGLAESEPALQRQLVYAMHGKLLGTAPIHIALDVQWRSKPPAE